MNINIVLKKLGNHWYPSIDHDDFQEIVLDSKIEKVLSFFDKNKTGQLNITFTKCNSVINNVLFFKDEDVTRSTWSEGAIPPKVNETKEQPLTIVAQSCAHPFQPQFP